MSLIDSLIWRLFQELIDPNIFPHPCVAQLNVQSLERDKVIILAWITCKASWLTASLRSHPVMEKRCPIRMLLSVKKSEWMEKKITRGTLWWCLSWFVIISDHYERLGHPKERIWKINSARKKGRIIPLLPWEGIEDHDNSIFSLLR